MSIVNRKNSGDAQKIIDEFIIDNRIKHSVLWFLSKAISYANDLDPGNWNLNLDKDGKFVRFNVGQVYCIEIFPEYISVLVLKRFIPKVLQEDYSNLIFKGHKGKKKIIAPRLDNVPDCLKKVPDSMACLVNYEGNIAEVLSYLEEANQKFIEQGIKHTNILPAMINAHSKGFISYLSRYCSKPIPDPTYTYTAVSNNVTTNLLEEIEECRSIYEGLQETDRQAIIQIRVGQEKFRTDLVKYWGGCAVTGCRNIEILRASHIKPWREASSEERLDVNNGLLLVPNLDVAFDAGFISFGDDGKIMISSCLSADDQNKLGIHSNFKLGKLTRQHIHYLQFHREYIFRGT